MGIEPYRFVPAGPGVQAQLIAPVELGHGLWLLLKGYRVVHEGNNGQDDDNRQDMELTLSVDQICAITASLPIEEYLRDEDEQWIGRVYPEGKPPTRWQLAEKSYGTDI
jgi:hypothetical protein